MDSDLRRQMLAYYDERAPEYEEAYTRGTGTASIRDPEVFKAEARIVAGIVAEHVRGRVMDLACGTAYWLPHYGPHGSRMTLFDQSAKMLDQARAKAHRLGMADRCVFLQGDVFEQEFDNGAYDTVLVGFFLSHLTTTQEPVVFNALRDMLDSAGRFLILDSAWSPTRARVNTKIERQTRRLNDGTAFEVYKRYCDRHDIARWAREHDVVLRIEHFGEAFYAVSGAFDRSSSAQKCLMSSDLPVPAVPNEPQRR